MLQDITVGLNDQVSHPAVLEMNRRVEIRSSDE